ncbi:DJ-1/PfpI family protein [Streptomyces sp. AV19]|uniref:DJ-1/PfpI family protein n=1 Tax=Streptomyces sp. AV19 TaxID=2793068 RepID=UPI0018FEAE58|nr:DJ-1/PfpI family protein [Streptomyces sp. AV19]MBH1937497.1 DJ-1/PfpI family protein [Streptomyces sp. AV19]MDG4533727.1 DJ-1/PfpI family protein [Streptomyces sp. AV19]
MRRRSVLKSAAAPAVAGVLGAGGIAAADERPEREKAAAHGRSTPLRVQIVMFDGAEEQDYIAPYEVFSAARKIGGAVETAYVSLDGPRTVESAYGTKIVVGRGWSPQSADLLVVPGGGWGTAGPGVPEEIRRGALPRALAAARRPGLVMASICTGAMLLSAAGLTKGRNCTTHHKVKDELRDRGGIVRDARVVDDGDLVTSGGITSGLDLALWLVQRELGESDRPVSLELMLEYERRGTVWRAPGAPV